MNLTDGIKISEAHAPIAAALNTDANTDILDMTGFDGVVFIVPIEDSAATGVATVTVEANTANSDSGMAAISGAVATVTDSAGGNDNLNGKLLIVDVYRPQKRYLQAAITSTIANIAFGTAIAIRYQGTKLPATDDATVAASAAVTG